ncbi:asparagine synthase (glutamine-hydrolyzing) [Pedobacter sp. P351]|uniref:asparagine synthase (glutamine-hydrolyzing) n=1 Tax=Pedobacter superstes TaxID=3133441 RepID=UPI0030B4C570
MCGIFGTINYRLSDDSSKVFKGLYHRGPDAHDNLELNNIQLYHTRLAIQDLSEAGAQPMQFDGIYIVFNGEIYNHMYLRKKYGLSSESHSDTKTILLLYQKMGMKMLNEFDGMFALALYDSNKNLLFLARDRAGKKPLYIYQKDASVVFSSELNTLYSITKAPINYSAISDYLYLGYHYRKSTPYQYVSELENGHYLKIDTKTNETGLYKWFDISLFYRQVNRITYKDAIEELDRKLHSAVKSRIESSDLDVGSFLSGGIDSGLVTAIAREYSSTLKTFTVKIEGAYDESSLANQVAEKFNTNHRVVEISFSDLKNDIVPLLINYGEPYCDSSSIPSYYVAKAAKQHITVALNGDGADELFGGYRRYVPFKYHDFFKSTDLSRMTASSLLRILPVANEKKSRYNYLYRLLKFASYKDNVKVYSSASSDMLVGYENQFLHRPELLDITANLEFINQLSLSSLNKLLLMDFQSILFSGLLPKMDIATMAHSLEGRSPFLSKDILEFAPGLSDEFKINNITTKYILRDLAKKYLPPDLINQPKRGFEIPLKKWIDNELKDIVADYLLAEDNLYSKIIRKSFIEDLISRKVRISDERRAKILFCIFGMEVWYRNLN